MSLETLKKKNSMEEVGGKRREKTSDGEIALYEGPKRAFTNAAMNVDATELHTFRRKRKGRESEEKRREQVYRKTEANLPDLAEYVRGGECRRHAAMFVCSSFHKREKKKRAKRKNGKKVRQTRGYFLC